MAEISSINVVGYLSATVAKNSSKTFSVALTDVANPTAPVAIDKLFSSMKNVSGAATWSDGGMDQIWTWRDNQWYKYGYQKTGGGRTGKPEAWAWMRCNYLGDKSLVALTEEDVVNPGETFLYKHCDNNSPAELTLSGQVREFGSPVGYTIPKNSSQFIALPWPVAFKLSDFTNLVTTVNVSGSATWSDGGMDQIWTWRNNQWYKYGYQKTGGGRTGKPEAWAWMRANYLTDKSLVALTDEDAVEAGEGFLYKHCDNNSPAIITFKPLQ